MKSAHKSTITAICQGGDDQPNRKKWLRLNGGEPTVSEISSFLLNKILLPKYKKDGWRDFSDIYCQVFCLTDDNHLIRMVHHLLRFFLLSNN